MSKRREAAFRICHTLTQKGHRALLAGGCVRDLLLGVEPKDYDIATSATPDTITELFPKTIQVGVAFGVQIIVLPEGQFEVATFRKDGAYSDGRHPDNVVFADEMEDAKRRDFTVNALFYDPATDSVIDYVEGRADMERRLLRAVGSPQKRFTEDHLRLLRAVRFAARLDYAIEDETMAAIIEMAHAVTTTSPERIRDEIIKMLTEGTPRRAFELLDQTGLLTHVLPEIALMKGIEQPPEFHPEGDVFTHTLLMLQKLPKEPTSILAWATLFHDVGKPMTQTFEDRIRFNRHDKVGAREAAKICRRLHLSNEETERIEWMVENHMRLEAAPKMRPSRLKRFARHEAFHDLVELCRLDCLASHGGLETIHWVERYLAETPPEQLRPKPLLRGDDLIQMGYTPGPVFAQILRTIEDAQLDESIVNAEQAREYVRNHWPLT